MSKLSSTSGVAEKAQDLFSASRKIARQGRREANSFIHENPVLSSLIGFGAGYLLSLIFRSRE